MSIILITTVDKSNESVTFKGTDKTGSLIKKVNVIH